MFLESGGFTGIEKPTNNLVMGLLNSALSVLPASPENDMLFNNLLVIVNIKMSSPFQSDPFQLNMIEVVRTFHVHSVTAHYRDKTCLE
jgi:hypothetical protein